ncbi:MAG: hypothetical protein J6A62_08050 [Oscillospiraceae bacterium]|nr:hypothetical protein [Oscillospiraceae bacterium]
MIALLIRAAKNAFGVSVAITAGGTLLPRLLHPERYADAPELLTHLWQNFYPVFVVIFAIWAAYYIIMFWNKK